MDTCTSCCATIPEGLEACEYCGAVKPNVPPVETLSTPASAFLKALGLGVLIPLIGFILPALGFGLVLRLFDIEESYFMLSLIPILLGFFVAIPYGFYRAARWLGYKWPDTSPWGWGLCLLAPLGILMLTQGMIPGLLFILPGYYGAKAGRKRRNANPLEPAIKL